MKKNELQTSQTVNHSTDCSLLPLEVTQIRMYKYCCCCSVATSCLTLYNPVDCSIPGSSVLHCLPKFAQIHLHWANDAIQLSHPAAHLLLPSILPSTRVFPKELALCFRWPKYRRFTFSISPSNEYSGLISLGLSSLISLLSKGLSRVFSNNTVQKHQLFRSQPSLWFNSHIHTWLLEKPWLWLYEPLLAK